MEKAECVVQEILRCSKLSLETTIWYTEDMKLASICGVLETSIMQ